MHLIRANGTNSSRGQDGVAAIQLQKSAAADSSYYEDGLEYIGVFMLLTGRGDSSFSVEGAKKRWQGCR
ncbi:MAG TPA: hypothetical protein VMP12_08355 [Candidatus Sulfotelmatobacter sp.]|nr:hypothetical protein [Candidatus Sulfotelmatobacter sp.]